MGKPDILSRPLAWLPGLSIRLRLTVFYSLTLGVTLLLFSSFIYVTLDRTLSAEVDRSLADRAAEVNRSVSVEILPLRDPQITIPAPNVYAAADIFVQVSYLDGRVLRTSDNLEGQQLPVDAADLEAARLGYAHYDTIEAGGERLRVLDAPLKVGNRPAFLLQVARTLEPTERTLNRLRLLLLAGTGVSLVLSALVGWALAQAGLAPIDRLTQAAEEIGASRDFGRRVEHAGPPDEVGRLAATFNLMLAQLQAAYAELQAAYSRTEAALASQRRFTADASHELRTPLTTIRGNAGLLQQMTGMSEEDRRESIDQIAGEAERMSRLVQGLLVLARADAGQHIAAKAPVALAPLVEEVGRQGRLMGSAKRVDVRVGEVAGVSVLGDRDSLKQLLLILVDNAVKYTPEGGHVTVSLSAAAGAAYLRVADTGIGIAAEDLPHIFERFYRSDRARQSGGTGLGLAIARWIAAEHGGAIEVASEPGKGSTFTVRLPVAE